MIMYAWDIIWTICNHKAMLTVILQTFTWRVNLGLCPANLTSSPFCIFQRSHCLQTVLEFSLFYLVRISHVPQQFYRGYERDGCHTVCLGTDHFSPEPIQCLLWIGCKQDCLSINTKSYCLLRVLAPLGMSSQLQNQCQVCGSHLQDQPTCCCVAESAQLLKLV